MPWVPVCGNDIARRVHGVACNFERDWTFFRCGGSNIIMRASPSVQPVSDMADVRNPVLVLFEFRFVSSILSVVLEFNHV
jgi:hypothetical protein